MNCQISVGQHELAQSDWKKKKKYQIILKISHLYYQTVNFIRLVSLLEFDKFNTLVITLAMGAFFYIRWSYWKLNRNKIISSVVAIMVNVIFNTTYFSFSNFILMPWWFKHIICLICVNGDFTVCGESE